MKTLFLLRHAKSDWDDTTLDDHERPLTPRGERACATIGRWLATTEESPELVLCSSARRAVDTLERVLTHLDGKPAVRIERELYLASGNTLLETLGQLGDEPASVMLVGHNPTLHALAMHLVGRGNEEDVERLAHQFPTAALAMLRHPVAGWGELAAAGGELLRFVTPSSLKG